jgi:hypothetical protein
MVVYIAIARQIFQKVFFFTSWGSFPSKKERKKSFSEKFARAIAITSLLTVAASVINGTEEEKIKS